MTSHPKASSGQSYPCPALFDVGRPVDYVLQITVVKFCPFIHQLIHPSIHLQLNSISGWHCYKWGVSEKNKLGCFKRLIGHRCHLGSNRHGWGPLLPGCSILSAQHQYMGSFPQFFAWKILFSVNLRYDVGARA